MKELKKILIAIAGFVACFLLLDYGVGQLFDWAIKRMPNEGERITKSEYVIHKVDADIIVVGSSRALCHYDSREMVDSFPNYSIYNCGIDGQPFYYTLISLNCMMDRYTPKVVIFDIVLGHFTKEEADDVSLLYPDYPTNKTVKMALDELDPTLKFTLWCNSYRYNATGGRILRALSMKDENTLGFSAHDAPDSTRIIKTHEMHLDNEQLVEERTRDFEETIQRAKNKGIKVILCVSPMHQKLVGNSMSKAYLKKISNKYHIPYYDMSQIEKVSSDNSLWYDEGHLNSKGARCFTEILIEVIKNNKDI